MNRAHLWIIAAILPCNAFADCGDITRRLFGFEVGGPRTYLSTLAPGISLQGKQEWLAGGVDRFSGRSQHVNNLSFQGQIHWHENRVAIVLATIQGGSTADIDSARGLLIAMSGTQVRPNAATFPIEALQCSDGLRAQLTRSQIVGSADSATPVLLLAVEDPRLKSEMQSALRSRGADESRLLSAARAGDTRAQLILGKSYLSKNDHAQARQWLRTAAEAGNAEAQHELGRSLGIFSAPESWSWFEKAASQGHEETVAYVRNVMFHRICDGQYGHRYLEFLTNVVSNARQHGKVHHSAEAALLHVTRYRERSGGNCN